MIFGYIVVDKDGDQQRFTVEADSIGEAAQCIERAWANCVAVWETSDSGSGIDPDLIV